MRWSPAPLTTSTPSLRWHGPQTPPLHRKHWKNQPSEPQTTRVCSLWWARWEFWVISPITPTSVLSYQLTRPRCGLPLGKTKVRFGYMMNVKAFIKRVIIDKWRLKYVCTLSFRWYNAGRGSFTVHPMHCPAQSPEFLPHLDLRLVQWAHSHSEIRH